MSILHYEVLLPFPPHSTACLQIECESDENPDYIAAMKALESSGYRYPRSNTHPVKVGVTRLKLRHGQLIKEKATVQVNPPLEEPTQENFEEDVEGMIIQLPGSFRNFIRAQAQAQIDYETKLYGPQNPPSLDQQLRIYQTLVNETIVALRGLT